MKSIGPNAIDRLPLDPVTGKPLQSKAQPGYYPGYSTLDQQGFWDAATRAVVLKRVQEVPPIRFFTAEEAHLLEAVCDHILPQDDRDFAHRIPIVPFIDKRLHDDRTDGYRFEDMPPDREAHRLGIKAINQMARELFGRDFLELSWLGQEELLLSDPRCQPKSGTKCLEASARPSLLGHVGSRLRRGLLCASLDLG